MANFKLNGNLGCLWAEILQQNEKIHAQTTINLIAYQETFHTPKQRRTRDEFR